MSECDFDVLVVGGGMAGCFAAMAAAERGCRVGIVEPSNVLGGQGTAGGVAGFCGDTARVNHLFDELVARLADHDLIQPYDPLADRRAYDLEWCGFFLQEMLLVRGVQPLLHARVLDVSAEAGRVTGVTVATAGDTLTLATRFVIDATGLCLVPQKAGFPVQHDGANQQLPMSLYFTLWDTGKPVKPILPKGVPNWENDNEIPMTSLHQFPSGKVEVKMKVVGFDAADGRGLAEAEVFARRHMMGLIYYLQTHGYRGVLLDRHVLASVSRQIGIREQRRLIGEHLLTEKEIANGCIFDDAMAVGTYHFDYHWPDQMQRAGTGITTMVEPYHIPLRCMIPKAAHNLLVPGRGASADQMALSSFRVMATVAQMGFAAGVAAAQAVKTDSLIGDVDIAAVQRDLQVSGQSLDLSDYGQYLRHIITTEECVAQPDQPVHRVALEQLSNGRFLAAWHTPAGTSRLMRSAGRWRKVSNGETPDMSRQCVQFGEGVEVRVHTSDGGSALELSRKDGRPASHRLDLVRGCPNGSDTPRPVALAATPRGVAAVYVDEQNQVCFWHGSPELFASLPSASPTCSRRAGKA